MGDIAEGLINGDFDSVTGEWMGSPGMGFPRSNDRDWNRSMYGRPEIRRERTDAQCIKGVLNFLQNNGYPDGQPALDLLERYWDYLQLGERAPELWFTAFCIRIQKDFDSFKKYVRDENIQQRKENAKNRGLRGNQGSQAGNPK